MARTGSSHDPLSLAQIAAVTGGTVCGDLALVVTGPAYLDSRSPLVLGEPGTASMSDQDRQQAVTALAAMIHRWWLNNRDRSADAVRGSDQPGGAAAGGEH
ncbi:MAG TPA: hypothetical protein VGR06_34390 [Actinophytocola sp.]|jgi:hypothetical protein|uniref:hypothetical protein n=1 Tax=Actinophytocola sp. TaxID=1872138 RepID=UPI002E05EC97|nr:hypothetical protein [Actinophytocola sp.]